MRPFGLYFSLLDFQITGRYFHFLLLKIRDRSLLGFAADGRAKTFQFLYVVNLEWM